MFRLGVEAVDIKPHEDACADFTHLSRHANASGDVLGVKSRGIDVVAKSLVDGSLVVEFLADDENGLKTKHLFGADHGVERAQARVI